MAHLGEHELSDALSASLGDSALYDIRTTNFAEFDSLLIAEILEVLADRGVILNEDVLFDIKDWSDLVFYVGQTETTGAARATLESSGSFVGKFVVLRPILPTDITPLYLMVQHPLVAPRFRFRSLTPSPELFNATLWDGVLSQYVICGRTGPEPLGLVSAFSANLGAGYCELAVMTAPHSRGGPHLREALEMFINHLFNAFPLRKIYAEMLDISLARLGLNRYPAVAEEGRKHAHEPVMGEFRDLVTLAIYRDRWPEIRGSLT